MGLGKKLLVDLPEALVSLLLASAPQDTMRGLPMVTNGRVVALVDQCLDTIQQVLSRRCCCHSHASLACHLTGSG